MAKYKAIENFSDNGTIYNIDDDYPVSGKADKGRVNYLLGNENGFGKPVIEEVGKTSYSEDETDGYGYN